MNLRQSFSWHAAAAKFSFSWPEEVHRRRHLFVTGRLNYAPMRTAHEGQSRNDEAFFGNALDDVCAVSGHLWRRDFRIQRALVRMSTMQCQPRRAKRNGVNRRPCSFRAACRFCGCVGGRDSAVCCRLRVGRCGTDVHFRVMASADRVADPYRRMALRSKIDFAGWMRRITGAAPSIGH